MTKTVLENGVLKTVNMTTEEEYEWLMMEQASAMSGTVKPTFDDILSALPITMPDGTVTTVGDAVSNGGSAPFALLSKWELCYDNGLCYKQVDDPDGIGSHDNPFIGTDIPQTSWPLKSGAYYRDGDKLYQYQTVEKLTGTVSSFVEVS